MVSFGEVTGRTDRDWVELCDTAPAGRLPLAMLAPIVAAFEHAMTDGEGKNTWRTDRYSPCPREQAASYFALLSGLGYQPSAIEQAVIGQQPYTGEVPPGQAEIGDGHGPEASADDAEVEAVPAGEPDIGEGDGDDEAPAEQPSAEADEDRAAA
jgi:hypothetical protein